jgi:hypothetical protein
MAGRDIYNKREDIISNKKKRKEMIGIDRRYLTFRSIGTASFFRFRGGRRRKGRRRGRRRGGAGKLDEWLEG